MEIASTIRLLSSLALVLALLALFLYTLRRSKVGSQFRSSGSIQILDRVSLESNKSLVLIEVRGQVSLLALANERVEPVWTQTSDSLPADSAER